MQNFPPSVQRNLTKLRSISCANLFHKPCRLCTSFQDALSVKIWMDLLKGLWSYGAFKLWRRVPANFQRSLAAKLCIRPQTFSRCKNVLEVLYHRAKFGGARISAAPQAAKNVEFFVCLFVCMSVRHAFERQSLCVRFRRQWSTETILIPLDRGRFVVVHSCPTFSNCCQLATPLNAEVQQKAKIGVFRRQRATE